MRSVTCSACGFVSWADGGDCKQCGKPLPVDQPYHRPPPQPSYGYEETHDYFSAPSKKRTGHAAASLTLGIIGFFTFGILLIGSVVGAVLGFVALKRESNEPATYGGKGMAIAGIVMNIFALVMIVPLSMIAAIAIPNLLAARQAANEASALRIMRVIMAAEQTYQSTDSKGECGEWKDLVDSGYLDAELSEGTKNGYRFTVVNNGSDYEVTATPVGSAGRHSFFYASDDDVLRARVGGLPATADDPPFKSYNDSQPSSRRASQPELRGPAYSPAD